MYAPQQFELQEGEMPDFALPLSCLSSRGVRLYDRLFKILLVLSLVLPILARKRPTRSEAAALDDRRAA
jgi:hypothetical protein